MAKNYLYLADFVVEELIVKQMNECAPDDYPICAEFNFRSAIHVTIFEDDFGRVGDTKDNCKKSDKGGKSCLFALDSPITDDDKLSIHVYKKKTERCKFLIGQTEMPIKPIFDEVTRKFEEKKEAEEKARAPKDPNKRSTQQGCAGGEEHIFEIPVSEMSKNLVQIFDLDENLTGSVVVIVRLTCMGTSVCPPMPPPPIQKRAAGMQGGPCGPCAPCAVNTGKSNRQAGYRDNMSDCSSGNGSKGSSAGGVCCCQSDSSSFCDNSSGQNIRTDVARSESAQETYYPNRRAAEKRGDGGKCCCKIFDGDAQRSARSGAAGKKNNDYLCLLKKIMDIATSCCKAKPSEVKKAMAEILQNESGNEDIAELCNQLQRCTSTNKDNMICDHLKRETNGKYRNAPGLPKIRPNMKHPANTNYDNSYVLPLPSCGGANTEKYRKSDKNRTCCVQINGSDIDNTMAGVNRNLPQGIEQRRGGHKCKCKCRCPRGTQTDKEKEKEKDKDDKDKDKGKGKDKDKDKEKGDKGDKEKPDKDKGKAKGAKGKGKGKK